jgi:hypothetical protein
MIVYFTYSTRGELEMPDDYEDFTNEEILEEARYILEGCILIREDKEELIDIDEPTVEVELDEE